MLYYSTPEPAVQMTENFRIYRIKSKYSSTRQKELQIKQSTDPLRK
jgi:hypothetical protein